MRLTNFDPSNGNISHYITVLILRQLEPLQERVIQTEQAIEKVTQQLERSVEPRVTQLEEAYTKPKPEVSDALPAIPLQIPAEAGKSYGVPSIGAVIDELRDKKVPFSHQEVRGHHRQYYRAAGKRMKIQASSHQAALCRRAQEGGDLQRVSRGLYIGK